MSYSEDAVNAKLSALNETQESIVTTAQWVMFHRRYADKTVKIWLDKLGNSSAAKRLNLVYLINEVAQQSKFRKREEFRKALSATIADCIHVAYNGGTNDIKNKIKRVIDVWKDRETFEPSVLDEIDQKVDAIDRKHGQMKRPLLGSEVPAAIAYDVLELNKCGMRAQLADKEIKNHADCLEGWEDIMNSVKSHSSSPLDAAKINSTYDRLMKGHAAALEVVNARKTMVEELERLLKFERELLGNNVELLETYDDRRAQTKEKRDLVDKALLASMQAADPWQESNETIAYGDASAGWREPEQPEMEAFTPPPANDDDDEGEYNPPEAGTNGNGGGTPPAMFGFEEPDEDEHPPKKRKLEGGHSAFAEDVDDLIRSEGRG